MSTRDDDVKQAIGQVAKLGGFNLKRMATTDDLKDHTITITITRTSDGWHQERLAFEDEQPLVASVNGRGEVVGLGLGGSALAETDPSDLTEKDETEPKAQPDPNDATGSDNATVAEMHPGVDTAELDDPKPDVHLVGEAAAAGRKRR